MKKKRVLVFTEDMEVIKHNPVTVDKTPPPEMLGRNLNSITDTKRWLLHPSNWIDTRLWIIKWDGIIPKISQFYAQKLIDEPGDDSIFEVVYRHQNMLRKKGKKKDDEDVNTFE